MDTSEFKELKAWTEARVNRTRGVTVGFSGSYSSAVTLALLMKCDLKVPVEPVFVMVKDDPWRILLADQWVSTLGHKTPLCKVILNETADDLEDQIPNLKNFRPTYIPPMIRMGLELVSRTSLRSIVWCGDRNAYALLPPPESTVPTICPLAHLNAGEVEALGQMVGVSDGWVTSWKGLPSGSWEGLKKNYRIFDRLVGIVLAHRDHIPDTSNLDFNWMGWEPSDNHDRVVISEIVDRVLRGKRSAAITVDPKTEVQLLDSGYEIQDTTPASYTLLGSVQFTSEADPENLRMMVRGRTTQGHPVDVGVTLTQGQVMELGERIKDAAQLLLPIRFRDDDGEKWIVLSLSQQALVSLKTALDDMSAYTAALPPQEEIVYRALTPAEIVARKAQRAKMANAPRPQSTRRP